MMFVENWSEAFTQSLQGVWFGVLNVLPSLVLAVVIFAIGWIFAVLVERVVEGIFKALRIDAALKSAGLEDVMKRAGHSLNSGGFVGALVKWFVIVVFLVASFDVLGLAQVNQFLKDVVLSYLPQVIIAVLVLTVAVVIAEAMQKLVVASARAAHIKSAQLLGSITRWAIWIFAIIIALFHLGIAPALIETIVKGVVAGVALALGLAFGLGGKDAASSAIDKAVKTFSDRE